MTRPVLVVGCHPERSEGALSMGTEMLRGVYPERSEGLSMTVPVLVGKVHNVASTPHARFIDDKGPGCHPERSEGSVACIRPADLTHVALTYGGITRKAALLIMPNMVYILGEHGTALEGTTGGCTATQE